VHLILAANIALNQQSHGLLVGALVIADILVQERTQLPDSIPEIGKQMRIVPEERLCVVSSVIILLSRWT